MNVTLLQQAREEIEKYFTGTNCRQAILKAFEVLYGKLEYKTADRTENIIAGKAQMCDALKGNILILNLLSKRKGEHFSVQIREKAQKEMYSRFIDYFGDSRCKVLNGNDFYSATHMRRCSAILSVAMKILLECLRELEIIDLSEPDNQIFTAPNISKMTGDKNRKRSH
ncbi:C-GCAxxG-C-C family (seleno)protein [Calderihabitans maritimus]|uniref:C_GCAxxG_C_C family probable redox protein n=1 Tax=Calderihabitans maritimus TaxID=1246530 RepID=A0A1Z5HUF1_9FIRM|nr:C-GCAxxG-C-C family (seleno)protein [Calderihabitans maritimus]GAW92955.1 C_GCAxxG_C_C family probable redox protein [Calderihabitans maritimus]